MLVVAPERWDEACFAVPAVRALAASGLAVGVLCVPAQAGFWETLDGIRVVATADQIDGAGWDAALAWQNGPLLRSARAAGIARRLAPAGDRRLEKWATDTIAPETRVLEHRVRYFLATVEQLGVGTRDAAFFAPVSMDARTAQPAVLLAPDSDFGPSHHWPLERWVGLARWLHDTHGPDIAVADNGVAGGKAGALHAAIHGTCGEVASIDFAPDTAAGLRALAGFPVVVAADGSLPHLAAHTGATCVVLFGPNDAVWRRPLGRRHEVVRHHVECAPCLMAKCPLDLRCQERLTVEEVCRAVDACMRRTSDG